MKKYYSLLVASLLIAGSSMAGVIWSEDFDPAPTILSDFNVQLGGTTNPINTKIIDFGEWAKTSSGSLLDDGSGTNNVLQTQIDGANNVKMVGVFLDPTLFGGNSGIYTLSFDVIGADAGKGMVYIYKGSGYDLTGATEAALNLNLSANGFPGLTGLTGVNGATASELASLEFDEQTSQTVTLDFTYDGSSAIAFSIGGYNTAFQIDNVTVVPEPATIGMLGLGALLTLLSRKMRS